MSLPQPTTVDKERVKKTAFQDEGILVVSIDDPRLPWQDRELLKQIGEKIYGRPRSAAVVQAGSNGRSW